MKSVELQFVAFSIGNEEYCIDISKVREVKEMMPITKVPQAPDDVEGIVNLRGQVIPIVNLKKNLGYYEENSLDNKIILVELENEIVGFIVDDVSDVVTIDEKEIEKPPGILGASTHHIKGIVKKEGRLLLILDVDKISSLKGF